MLTNLLPLAIGLGAVTLLAKVNKNNKMFWIFLVSMLLGFAGGSVSKNYKKFTDKKVGIMQINPMQTSTMSTIIDFDDAMLQDTSTESTKYAYVKSAGQDYSLYRDMIPNCNPGITFNPEDDTGITEPINSS